MTPVTEPTVLSVGQYLDLANRVLREYVARDLFVEGEISGYTVKDGKWIIFQLKDEQDARAKVNCFATTFKINGAFEDGMRVRVSGYPTVKEWSAFQIDVQTMEPVGEGALKKAYEALKKKLEAEGLFDVARKRVLPRFPERIGLITSRDAAAYGDFLRILNNRWGGAQVEFAHVHVQGKEAVAEILGAFAYFNALPEEDRPEVLVLTRGGGSLEDLHAFNDEAVARAVYGSKIPVVCGVGHERDESLCDFVADVRASTPSNAAERVVPNRKDVLTEVHVMERRVDERLRFAIEERLRVIDRTTLIGESLLVHAREKTLAASRRVVEGADRWLKPWREAVLAHERVLRNVDPKRVLERGYAIATVGTRVVTDAARLEIGAEIGVQLSKGSFDAEVLRVNGRGKQKLV